MSSRRRYYGRKLTVLNSTADLLEMRSLLSGLAISVGEFDPVATEVNRESPPSATPSVVATLPSDVDYGALASDGEVTAPVSSNPPSPKSPPTVALSATTATEEHALAAVLPTTSTSAIQGGRSQSSDVGDRAAPTVDEITAPSVDESDATPTALLDDVVGSDVATVVPSNEATFSPGGQSLVQTNLEQLGDSSNVTVSWSPRVAVPAGTTYSNDALATVEPTDTANPPASPGGTDEDVLLPDSQLSETAESEEDIQELATLEGTASGAEGEISLLSRGADLLASFAPFNQGSIEQAIDHFLGELGQVDATLTGLGVSEGLIPSLAATGIVVYAAETVRRRLRSLDMDVEAVGDTSFPGLPGQSQRWDLEGE